MKPCYSKKGGFIPSPLGRPSGIAQHGSAVQPKAPARCASETSAICCWINSWTKPQWPGWQLSAWPEGWKWFIIRGTWWRYGPGQTYRQNYTVYYHWIFKPKSSNTMLQMTSPYWPWSGHEPRNATNTLFCSSLLIIPKVQNRPYMALHPVESGMTGVVIYSLDCVGALRKNSYSQSGWTIGGPIHIFFMSTGNMFHHFPKWTVKTSNIMCN